MADNEGPVSWMTLEKGTAIVSVDGKHLGTVGEIVADHQKDIFSGVTISSGLLGADLFAPADLVDSMSGAAVRLIISAEQAEKLEPYGA